MSPDLPTYRFGPLEGQPDVSRGRIVSGFGFDSHDVTVLSVRGPCQEAALLGITLGIAIEHEHHRPKHDGEEDSFTQPFVRAIIQWGIGGITFSAECDFLHGTMLSVPAENLIISARYLALTRSWNPQCDPCCLPTYRVSAGLSIGGAGRGNHPARLTELAQMEKPGDSAFVAIPPFATSFTVLPIQDSKVSVDMLSCGRAYRVRNVIVSPLSNESQNNTTESVPIFNGARYLEVINRNESGPAYAFVIFGLTL